MLQVGQLVRVHGLKNRPEFNERPAIVVSRGASDESRFNVYVDGHNKKLLLKPDNLQPDKEAVVVERTPPDIVAVGSDARIGVVIARRGDNLVHVEYLQRSGRSGIVSGGGGSEWALLDGDGAFGASEAMIARSLEESDETSTPTQLLVGSRVLARDTHKRGGPKAFSDGSVVDVRREANDGRLWLYVEWERKHGNASGLWLSADEVKEAPQANNQDGDDGDDGVFETSQPVPDARPPGANAAAKPKAPAADKAKGRQGKEAVKQPPAEEERKATGAKRKAPATTVVVDATNGAPTSETEGGKRPVGRNGKGKAPMAAPAAASAPKGLCVGFLVRHIDAVASFGVLSGGIQHSIAAGLCAVRRLDDRALELLTQADASVTELVVPDCSHVTEEALVAAIGRLTNASAAAVADDDGEAAAGEGGGLWDLNPEEDRAERPSRLSLVDLGFCGRPFTARVAALLYPLSALRTLRLRGCFKLSSGTVVELLRRRGGGLGELVLSGNCQLGADAVRAIGEHCPHLTSLKLEDCDHLPTDAFLPLRRLARLETLSLSGCVMLDGQTLATVTEASSACLGALHLRACSLLGDDALTTVAATCPNLRDIDLEGVEMLTDAACLALADHLPALERLVLKGCVMLTDAALEAVAAKCTGLVDLSLNKLVALSDAALVALAAHCADSLRTLDVSWCRGVTDHGLGALVDACERLEELSLWGCTQLTKTFYDGHSNDELRVVGRFGR